MFVPSLRSELFGLRGPELIWEPLEISVLGGSGLVVPRSEIPPVLLGIPWPALRGPLWNHFWRKKRPQPWGREFWKCSGAFKCLELQGLGHPSRTLEGNSRKRSESISGVFPEFFRNFLRKVPAVLGVWPTRTPSRCPERFSNLMFLSLS